MIDSTSSSDRAARATPYTGDLQRSPIRPNPVAGDQLSTQQAEQLHQALAQSPEIRPDVLARGRELAADPNYPPAAVIASVASQIVNSPDLSETDS
jgi:hypothetical protein